MPSRVFAGDIGKCLSIVLISIARNLGMNMAAMFLDGQRRWTMIPQTDDVQIAWQWGASWLICDIPTSRVAITNWDGLPDSAQQAYDLFVNSCTDQQHGDKSRRRKLCAAFRAVGVLRERWTREDLSVPIDIVSEYLLICLGGLPPNDAFKLPPLRKRARVVYYEEATEPRSKR